MMRAQIARAAEIARDLPASETVAWTCMMVGLALFFVMLVGMTA